MQLLFVVNLAKTIVQPPTVFLRSARTVSIMTARDVKKVVNATEQSEGVGATVRRSIGRSELNNLDPFLLLDEFTVQPPAGFPE